MTRANLRRSLTLSAAGLLAAITVISGCSKKQEPVATQPATPVAETNPVPTTAAVEAAPQAPTGPVLDASQMGDAKQAMAEADAALRQKEYEKAVKTMLAIQQAQLNAQQAEAARQAMIALQRNLANAAANGDQNAIAAGELIRAAHRH